MANTINEQGVVNRYKAYKATNDKSFLTPPSKPGDGALGYLTSAGTGAAAGASVAGPWGALIGGALGMGQQFMNQGATEDAYKAQMQAYNDQLLADAEAKVEQQKQQAIANLYADANNAAGTQDSILSKYKSYNQMVGK